MRIPARRVGTTGRATTSIGTLPMRWQGSWPDQPAPSTRARLGATSRSSITPVRHKSPGVASDSATRLRKAALANGEQTGWGNGIFRGGRRGFSNRHHNRRDATTPDFALGLGVDSGRGRSVLPAPSHPALCRRSPDAPHLDFGLPYVEAHPVGPRFQAHFTAEPSAFSSTRGPTTGRVFASSTTGLVPQDATASARGPSRKNDDGVQPFFVYVPIINHDRPGRRAAEHPYGKLWFQTVSGDRIFSDLNARWAGTDPDFQLTRPRSLDSIPANGNHYDLDVAFKYLDDDHCYAFTDDNSSHEGLRKPDHLITDRTVLLAWWLPRRDSGAYKESS